LIQNYVNPLRTLRKLCVLCGKKLNRKEHKEIHAKSTKKNARLPETTSTLNTKLF